MDGASEILTLGGSLPNASLTYRNGIYRLTLMGDRSDASWLAALRAIQYQNTSITPSAGLRTITFTAYNAIKSNQAKDLYSHRITPLCRKRHFSCRMCFNADRWYIAASRWAIRWLLVTTIKCVQ
ncbi:MAG: hypothetical protein U0T36_12240 [Saprospiraceae bacterium]